MVVEGNHSTRLVNIKKSAALWWVSPWRPLFIHFCYCCCSSTSMPEVQAAVQWPKGLLPSQGTWVRCPYLHDPAGRTTNVAVCLLENGTKLSGRKNLQETKEIITEKRRMWRWKQRKQRQKGSLWIKFPVPCCLKDWMIFMIFAGLSTLNLWKGQGREPDKKKRW